jgi:hypothetical protein
MKTKSFVALLCASLVPAVRAAFADGVTLENFKLIGNLANGDAAAFTLTANARVDTTGGVSLDLLSGAVALTEVQNSAKSRINTCNNHYILTFDRKGVYPINIRFNAAVHQQEDWSGVAFQVAPGTLQPIVLPGLAADTQFNFPNAARPVVGLRLERNQAPAFSSSRPSSAGEKRNVGDSKRKIKPSPGAVRSNPQRARSHWCFG